MKKLLLIILTILCSFSVNAKKKIDPEHQRRVYDYLFNEKSYEDAEKNYENLNLTGIEVKPDYIKYFIYSKNIREQEMNLKDTIKKTLDTRIPTRVLIHGWMESRYSNMVITVRNAYLASYIPVNIIVVDWSAYSKNSYIIVRSRVSNVGYFVAKFLQTLIKKFGLKTEQIQLIGFSMGAHIAGIVGKNMGNKRIPVIYGLDPAAPLFDFHKKNERLDASDADYVEVIHTSAELLGYEDAIGTTDFYVNFGYKQPGCGWDILSLCSHSRSFKYFAESIKSKANLFWGMECKNGVDDMQNGSCSYTGHYEILGGNLMKINEAKKPGVYYVATRASSPFAKRLTKYYYN